MTPSGSDDMPDDAILKDLRVLVVEDTWHVAMALKSALTDIGVVVIGPTKTAAGTKQMVAEQHPQLVLVDINLDGKTAFDLVHWLLERGLRVIVMSGLGSMPTSLSRRVAFLQKPFGADELLAVMRETMLTKR